MTSILYSLDATATLLLSTMRAFSPGDVAHASKTISSTSPSFLPVFRIRVSRKSPRIYNRLEPRFESDKVLWLTTSQLPQHTMGSDIPLPQPLQDMALEPCPFTKAIISMERAVVTTEAIRKGHFRRGLELMHSIGCPIGGLRSWRLNRALGAVISSLSHANCLVCKTGVLFACSSVDQCLF